MLTRGSLPLLASAVVLLACSPDSSDGAESTLVGGASDASTGAGDASSAAGDGDGDGGGDGDGDGDGGATSGPTSGTGGEGGATGGPGTGGDETSAGGDGDSGGATGAGGEGGEGGSGPPPCAAGTVQCDGTVQQICDGEGGYTDIVECAPGGCVFGVGCTFCQPGSATCDGNVSSVCDNDGEGVEVFTCDPVQGSVCDAGTGHCTGSCSPERLGDSYIGCDYYPTVTKNDLLNAAFTFSIAVANTTDNAATVTVTRGGGAVVTETVDPQSVRIIGLPWVEDLRLASSSTLVPDGAYRVRTTEPVTVYQYNPLQYTLGGGNNSYTNDASLLLPTNAWTGNYRVAAFNSFYFWSGFYSVTAREDGTTVTLSPSASGASVLEGGGVPANGTGSVVLNEGDVLQVLSSYDGSLSHQPYDLTGTLVAADKPVQVFGGHNCLYLPADTGYCDHLEESMPPVETLSTEYIVTPPEWAAGGPDSEWVRIIATEAATTVSYDPVVPGAATTLANAGDYIQIPASSQDFAVTSDKPILVSQYMRGQGDSGIPGDPAMALAVATEQYRTSYLFHAPTNYSSNYVNITAPTGATVTLDGVDVSGFVAIGASGYSVARVPLSNAGDGNHGVTGTMPFGISVYGYGDDTSYWYPGGLDLERFN